MFNVLMANSDIFDKMYQEINRQNTFYFWIIGIVLAITVAITGFFGFLQWKLSDKQIENMKSQVLQQVDDTYKARVEHLENILKRYKEYQNDQALHLANSLNDKFSKLLVDKDIVQLSADRNDIIFTIESIVNNDMISDMAKTVAMKFVEVNIDNFKRGKREAIVDPIYKHIINNKKLKIYYEASHHLFDNPNDNIKDSNGK